MHGEATATAAEHRSMERLKSHARSFPNSLGLQVCTSVRSEILQLLIPAGQRVLHRRLSFAQRQRAQGEQMPARPRAEAEFVMMRADALAALDAPVRVDEQFHRFMLGHPGDDRASVGRLSASVEYRFL